MQFGLARVEQWNLGLSAGAVAASLALATPHFATSLAAGAFLEAVNLGALRRSALRYFGGEMTRSWTGAFTLRFLLLGAGIFLTLQAGAHPVALLIGLSIAMPAVLVDAWLNRPPILDPATLPVFLDDEDERDGDRERDARGSAAGPAHTDGLSLTGELFRTHVTPRGFRADDTRLETARPETTQPESAAPAPDETSR
jgi:hypothetical protein